MKKKMFLAMLACGLIFTTACGEKKNNNSTNPTNNGNNGTEQPEVVEPKANTNAQVIGEVEIDGLKINNVSVISEGEHTTFSADVTNTTSEPIDVKSFNIILKDANGEEVVTLLGFIGGTIAPNNSSTITSFVEMDLSSVASVEYTRNY